MSFFTLLDSLHNEFYAGEPPVYNVIILNNGYVVSMSKSISEEWTSDDEFFVTESEIQENNKLYHQLKKELRIRKT